jgi:hypothetical protein
MKIWKFLLIGALTSIAFAASSYDESSNDIAKSIAPKLAGKTVAVLDLQDSSKNVRELGRVIATQSLNVALSDAGVKLVNRSSLERVLKELNLSQAGLVEAISGGEGGNKFKAADVIVTGTLSQGGEQYNMAIEAIDVKTGDYIALARSQFPKTASVQTLWDTYIQTEPAAKGQQAEPSQGQDLSITDFPPGEDKYFRIQLKSCKKGDQNLVKCIFVLTNLQQKDDTITLVKNRNDGSFTVDQNGTIYLPDSLDFSLAKTNQYKLFPNIPVQIVAVYRIPINLNKFSLVQIGFATQNLCCNSVEWSSRYSDVPISR